MSSWRLLQVEKLLSEISSLAKGGKQQRPDSASSSPLESRVRVFERLASEVARLNFYSAASVPSLPTHCRMSVAPPWQPYVPSWCCHASTLKRCNFSMAGVRVSAQIDAQRQALRPACDVLRVECTPTGSLALPLMTL